MSFIGSIWAMDADAESLPSINLPTIYGDWEERSLPSLPDYEHLDIDDMDIDAATALVSDSQASVSQIRRARRRIPMLLRAVNSCSRGAGEKAKAAKRVSRAYLAAATLTDLANAK